MDPSPFRSTEPAGREAVQTAPPAHAARIAHTARISLTFDDEAAAAAVAGAISVEADEGPDGSTVRIVRNGATLSMDVTAADVATLRAALHSLVRLAEAAERTAAAAGRPAQPAAQRRKP